MNKTKHIDELARAAQFGTPGAVEALLMAIPPYLRSLTRIYRFEQGGDDGDVMAVALAAVWEWALPTWQEGRGSFHWWAWRWARRRVAQAVRRANRSPGGPVLPLAAAYSVHTDDDRPVNLRDEIVHLLLSTLKPSHRDVTLRVYSGELVKEVAFSLGLSPQRASGMVNDSVQEMRETAMRLVRHLPFPYEQQLWKRKRRIRKKLGRVDEALRSEIEDLVWAMWRRERGIPEPRKVISEPAPSSYTRSEGVRWSGRFELIRP